MKSRQKGMITKVAGVKVARLANRKWCWIALLVVVVVVSVLLLRNGELLASDGDDRPAYMAPPYRYEDELDFRIIVLTHDRPESLRKCLDRLADLDTLGDRVGVDIWIDRFKDGAYNRRTRLVAERFRTAAHRNLHYVHVHIQPNHSYIIGQWINTWRPGDNSTEMALILEDDIDLSRFAYRWLKAANDFFGPWPDVIGYTLQMENVHFVKENDYRPAAGPKTDPVFLFHLTGTWGYSPKAGHWRRFQDWFHAVWNDPDFRPYLPGTHINRWYLDYERRGRACSMWEMYLIYYAHTNNLFTVYPNLIAYTGRDDVLLDTNRQEYGLHFPSKRHSVDRSSKLMRTWNASYVQFTKNVAKYVFSDR